MDYSKWIEEVFNGIGDFLETHKKEITAGAIGGGLIGTATYLICDEDKKKAVSEAKIEAKKEGYAEASNVYEQLLREQAEEFIKQKRNAQRSNEEYEQLLFEYEEYIKKLERENASYSKVKEHLDRYEKLKKAI